MDDVDSKQLAPGILRLGGHYSKLDERLGWEEDWIEIATVELCTFANSAQ
jgi:hypothetical protein